MTQPLMVACGYVVRRGRVLLAQRAENRLWELPGGKQEPGESLAACLRRELMEELDIQAVVLEPLGEVRFETQAHRQLELHCFLCSILMGDPMAKEHADLAWVDPADLLSYRLCPADRELLQTMPHLNTRLSNSKFAPMP